MTALTDALQKYANDRHVPLRRQSYQCPGHVERHSPQSIFAKAQFISKLCFGQKAGFETLLVDHRLSPLITTFFCPADPNFDFERFYELLKAKGCIICPGKLTVVESFRVGCIGQMDKHVMRVIAAAKGRLDH